MDHPVDIAALILCIVPVLTFSLIIRRQFSFRNANPALYPMIIISIRTASLLPLFALLIAIAVWFPATFQALVPLETVLEGYAVLGFYALITTNCGGPQSVIKILAASDRIACCDCQSQQPSRCYKRVYRAIWQFVYIRPFVATIGAVVWYRTELDSVFLLLQGICFLQTFWMLVGLLSLAYTLYDDCFGLNIVYKLLVIKVSVGLVVIQGFVIDNLYNYGYITIPEKYSFSTYSEDAKIQRAYCLLCLVEFVLLSAPLWLGFGYQITPSRYFDSTPLSLGAAEDADSTAGPDAKYNNITSNNKHSEHSISLRGKSRESVGDLIVFIGDCLNMWVCALDPIVQLPADGSGAPLLGAEND